MPLEDVYVTGLLAKIVGGVDHVPLDGFLVQQPNGCDVIVSVERLLAVWEEMENKTQCVIDKHNNTLLVATTVAPDAVSINISVFQFIFMEICN